MHSGASWATRPPQWRINYGGLTIDILWRLGQYLLWRLWGASALHCLFSFTRQSSSRSAWVRRSAMCAKLQILNSGLPNLSRTAR